MKSKYFSVLFSVGAVVVGLAISACMLLFLGVDPISVFVQSFVSIVTDKYTFGEVLVKATPLMFTALAFALTYQASLFNIGAQGQFYAGSVVAVALSLQWGDVLPTVVLIPLVLIASSIGGGIVGALIGYAKARFGANEFLVSMMSTYVVMAIMDYLLRTVLRETKGEYLQTDAISKSAYLPNILSGTRVHLGFALAVIAAILVWVLLYHTPLGFRIRAVGKNGNAAILAGVPARKVCVISFFLSGALAGMAGCIEINGIQHLLLQDFNPSVGSYGIGIAILAGGNPIGVIFSALLFGFLTVMGTVMARLPGLNIPSSVVDLMQGIVMICVIISYFLRTYVERQHKKNALKKAGGQG